MNGPNCALCVNLASERIPAAAKVNGYWVCLPHAGFMEQAASLFDALRLARHHNAIRGTAA